MAYRNGDSRRKRKASRRRRKLLRRGVRVVGAGGPPCPRCGCATEIREHKEITEKQERQKVYYRKWYYCTNRGCDTKTIHDATFIVRNDWTLG
jgi:hypothetical protein